MFFYRLLFLDKLLSGSASKFFRSLIAIFLPISSIDKAVAVDIVLISIFCDNKFLAISIVPLA